MKSTEMRDYEKLAELCKPILEELKEHFHPHVSVVISVDGIRVEESVFGIPSIKL
ncbi:hypothetical protein [Filifactor villosus]|uniref:Uncharacterized protein n=1 Tax=Filifactor villosus TaxID=29374 RepID=A0ABV9QMA4_9FIRM